MSNTSKESNNSKGLSKEQLEKVRVPLSKRRHSRAKGGPFACVEKYLDPRFHHRLVNDTPGNVDHVEQILMYERVRDPETGREVTVDIKHGDCNKAYLMRLPLEEYELRRREDEEDYDHRMKQSLNQENKQGGISEQSITEDAFRKRR